MSARSALHMLEDMCEEQNDAMQEWLDTQREQPTPSMPQAERDGLLARARDVIEHIQRVVHHVRRMEHGAETAVQIHFSALGHRTNEIMRVLTALTAVFLPLNFITGFFGMNFEFLPLIHSAQAMWAMLGLMAAVAFIVLVVFWRKRYLARVGR
jgi:Mg2+ and Co2+ transporter CorA